MIIKEKYKDYKLCYVEHGFLYFTDDFDNQWGDDWNDIPYEHNAGKPYGYQREDHQDVFAVAYQDHIFGGLETPSSQEVNSPYSVEKINDREIPWLKDYFDEESINIWGGETFQKVIDKTKMRDSLELFYPKSILE